MNDAGSDFDLDGRRMSFAKFAAENPTSEVVIHGGLDFDKALALASNYFDMFSRLWLSPEAVDERKAKAVEQIDRAAKICESPIELAILPWLVFSDWSPIAAPPVPIHIVGSREAFPNTSLVIIPQLRLANSRFDFVLNIQVQGGRRMIAVECDGAEFHNVRDDLERDRYFWGWGIPTVRLPGHVIARGPQRAVEEVINAATFAIKGGAP